MSPQVPWITLVGEVLKVMETVETRGMTQILVTHEVAFARAVADRVLFLHDGAIVEEGTPEQVFQAPRNPLTRIPGKISTDMIALLAALISLVGASGDLRWGADPEGGAPYIFADPTRPGSHRLRSRNHGALAAEMGRRDVCSGSMGGIDSWT